MAAISFGDRQVRGGGQLRGSGQVPGGITLAVMRRGTSSVLRHVCECDCCVHGFGSKCTGVGALGPGFGPNGVVTRTGIALGLQQFKCKYFLWTGLVPKCKNVLWTRFRGQLGSHLSMLRSLLIM